jgi:uncharacterized membrane protein YidH (DUF202 family)
LPIAEQEDRHNYFSAPGQLCVIAVAAVVVVLPLMLLMLPLSLLSPLESVGAGRVASV